jgi:hypothetical protein
MELFWLCDVVFVCRQSTRFLVGILKHRHVQAATRHSSVRLAMSAIYYNQKILRTMERALIGEFIWAALATLPVMPNVALKPPAKHGRCKRHPGYSRSQRACCMGWSRQFDSAEAPAAHAWRGSSGRCEWPQGLHRKLVARAEYCNKFVVVAWLHPCISAPWR